MKKTELRSFFFNILITLLNFYCLFAKTINISYGTRVSRFAIKAISSKTYPGILATRPLRNPNRLANEVINIFRVNDLIDLPVIESMSAQRLCTIRDVIIDMRESRVYALVCKERLFRRYLEAIPFRNVAAITQNNVAVTGKIDQISLRGLGMKYRRFQSYKNILGKIVLSSRSETLGIIRDLLIDTNSGIIKAYELSEGYIDDILTGRHIVELECGHTFSDKNVVLKDHNAQC